MGAVEAPASDRMDLATVIGVVLCTILILVSIVLGGSPVLFVNIPSMLIVVGGTVGASMMRNSLSEVVGTAKVVGTAFQMRLLSPVAVIDRIVELARKSRKEGMLALENEDCGYDYLQKGVGLAVDGLERQEISKILTNDLHGMINRHKRGKEILEGMGQAAPAFGMIGTLIGLVQMLASLEDPSSIGPAMAVALLTTLYGALISNVICLPLADKLKARSAEEVLLMSVCLEGVLSLAEGDNPNSIDQKLRAFIAPNLRDSGSDGKGDAQQEQPAEEQAA